MAEKEESAILIKQWLSIAGLPFSAILAALLLVEIRTMRA